MAKKWVFTAKRKAALKKAQQEHVELVALGMKSRGKHSSARQVRLGRASRNN